MHCGVFHSLRKRFDETGSGLVGFVLVAPLLVLVFIAVGQISIIVADKTVLHAAATIGARAASAADATNATGFKVAQAVLASRSKNFSAAKISVIQERIAGIDYVVVKISREVDIQWINQHISLNSTARSVNERKL